MKRVNVMKLYFRDNFFSAGETDIVNEREEVVGRLNLRSAFSSKIDVYGDDGHLLYDGRFPFFSSRWRISNELGEQVGIVRRRFTFAKKKFTYETVGRGSYEIVSPAFSRDYEIFDQGEQCVVRFSRVSGWFASGAFELHNESELLDSYELVAVVMGMHAIQKRQNTAANSGV